MTSAFQCGHAKTETNTGVRVHKRPSGTYEYPYCRKCSRRKAQDAYWATHPPRDDSVFGCGHLKTPDNMTKNMGGFRCTTCSRAGALRWAKDNPERMRASRRNTRLHNPAADREHKRRYRQKQPYYSMWRSMKTRCNNPNADSYKYYGERGIQVCDEWKSYKSFEASLLATVGPRPEGMTLDRIDPDGDYEPQNVRWATYSEQTRNQRKRR